MSTLNAGETLQPLKPLQNNLIFDSSGNMVGIQNDRANGTDLRLNGGSAGTFSSLVVQAAGTFDLYNTADQTTNYERLRASFVANTATLITQQGGTGIFRAISLASGNGGALTIAGLPSNTNGMSFTYGVSNSSGTQTLFKFQPTIVQSGTAGYTGIDIDVQESTTGSGTKLLQRWAVGGSAKAYVDNAGSLAALLVYTPGILMGATLGAVDLLLNRDGPDIFALRRLTIEQTFRGYETYTDASNYSRWYQTFNGGFAYYGTQAAGTGTRRPLIVQHHQTTVAALPAAATAGAGSRCHVSDALGPVFGTAVAGGGAVSVPVYSDGANWIVG